MSGIVGIFHADRSPVEAATLKRLTDFLAFRGPDALGTWIEGPVGFGHTLFRTSDEARSEQQPFSLDGKIWIVADARLDARADLTEKLQHQSARALRDASDAELILRGYGAWGEQCVEHFLGDFAFGIWDGPRQRLFCARDQMGVRPFYYAHLGAVVIFSNTLECIRRHPGVSDRLNELAIADFLLLQHNQDPATTTFTDIERLPAAHTASFSAGDKRVQRYWTMPVDPPLVLRRPDDYTDRFKELLWQVVGDRLRSCSVGLFLSGGLDSTTMAAGAAKMLRERCADGGKLVALSMTDKANPSEEEHATLAAKALGIPIHFFPWDETIDPAWESTPSPTPEPALGPWDLATTRRYFAKAATLNRVFFHGEGPDHALHFEWQPYVSHLLAAGQYGRLFREMAKTMMCNRRVPISVRGPALLARRRVHVHGGTEPPAFPDWLNPNLESRFGVRARWDARWTQSSAAGGLAHPIRPVAYGSLDDGFWRTLFERQDAGWTGALVEVRDPLADVRMLRFLLSVPPLPWCRAKYLLRRAMRGILPGRVLRRAKWALTADILIDRIVGTGLAPLAPEPELGEFVDVRRFPAASNTHLWLFGCELRVRLLNHWLKYRSDPPRDGSSRSGARQHLVNLMERRYL